jgi:hypothetical protein
MYNMLWCYLLNPWPKFEYVYPMNDYFNKAPVWNKNLSWEAHSRTLVKKNLSFLGTRKFDTQFLIDIPRHASQHTTYWFLTMSLLAMLRNGVLQNLYSQPNTIWMIKSRRLRCAGHLARMGAMRNAYRILVGKPEWKRLLGIYKCMWENNIKKYLSEMESGDVDRIDLTIMKLRVP